MSTLISILEEAYERFNRRDIAGLLALMTPNVTWPNGWEGGFVKGPQAVQEYWMRQWKELNPVVNPLAFVTLNDESIQVKVHQVVHDMTGNLVVDGFVYHTYTFKSNKIHQMEITQE